MNIGTRVTVPSYGKGTVIAYDDALVIFNYPDWPKNIREKYTWVEFDDGRTNGWTSDWAKQYLKVIDIDAQIEAAKKALDDLIAMKKRKSLQIGATFIDGFNVTQEIVATHGEYVWAKPSSNEGGPSTYTVDYVLARLPKKAL